MMDEGMQIKGSLTLVLAKLSGEVEVVHKDNIIVNGGFDFVADAIGNSGSRPGVMGWIAVGTHWSHRKDCPDCPMLQICKGACMFLQGPLWEASCDNAYSDALPIFASGIEFMTGLVPVHIEGELREDRKDIFGLTNQITNAPVEPQNSARKPFPIPVVSA